MTIKNKKFFGDPAIITLKNTEAKIAILGAILLTFEDESTIEVSLNSDNPAAIEFFTTAFQSCKKVETETKMLGAIKLNDFVSVIAGKVYDDFTYPESLIALTSDSIALNRAKGKVTPGSVEVLIDHTKVTVDEVKAIKDKLSVISGFHIVNTKPIPVTDSDGMPIAIKFIVSPKSI